MNNNRKHPLFDYAMNFYKNAGYINADQVVNYWHLLGDEQFERWLWLIQFCRGIAIEENKDKIHVVK